MLRGTVMKKQQNKKLNIYGLLNAMENKFVMQIETP